MHLCQSVLYAENCCYCCVISSNPAGGAVADYVSASSSLPLARPFQRPS